MFLCYCHVPNRRVSKEKSRSGKRKATGIRRGRPKGGRPMKDAHAFMYACFKNKMLTPEVCKE